MSRVCGGAEEVLLRVCRLDHRHKKEIDWKRTSACSTKASIQEHISKLLLLKSSFLSNQNLNYLSQVLNILQQIQSKKFILNSTHFFHKN